MCYRAVWQAQYIFFRLSGDDVLYVLRVYGAYVLYAYVAVLCHLLEVQVLVYVQCVRAYGYVGLHGADAVLLVIGHYVVCCNERGQVTACLAWQVTIYLPEIGLAARAQNSLLHVAGSAVIGCNGKVPAVEELV